MLGQLKAIRPWVQALRAYRAEDYDLALHLTERSFTLDSHPDDYQLAFYGTLLILNHRSLEAEQVFEQAQASRPSLFGGADYVRAYCAYYLELIGRGDRAAAFWEQARSLRQTRFTRRYLSLPPIPVP